MPNLPDTPGERLRLFRRQAGLSAKELGRRAAPLMGREASISESAVRNQENGTNGIPSKAARAYAEILGVDVEELLFGDREDPLINVPILGPISSTWRAIPPEFTVQMLAEIIKINLPGYQKGQIFGYRSAGGSMPTDYPEEAILLAAHAEIIGVRSGAHVVAQRLRGAVIEECLRTVHLSGRTPVLRSFNPDEADVVWDDKKHSVNGVVVATIRLMPTGEGPLIRPMS